MERRRFLASCALFAGFLLFRPGKLIAEWVTGNFQQVPIQDAFRNVLGTAEITKTDKITITAPEAASDGSMVPVEIMSALKAERLYLFVEKNLTPLVFTCTLHGKALPWFALNIKMKESSALYAVIWDGRQYLMSTVHVDVLAQAC
ncbi:MAG: thiosulfate-binding protein SoxY [Chlorobiaceae bacterium]|nr:thiosulfate-binding protein SoxY [Chlorobiaceae bacterium]NTW10336.1 thiosulfate-binding protein SoxY [Chlorobiaceae bacterium]